MYTIYLHESLVLSILILITMLIVTLLLKVSFTWLLSLPYSFPEPEIFRGTRESVENRIVSEHYRCLRFIWIICLIEAGVLIVIN